MPREFRVIDAHVAGAPIRVVTAGARRPDGPTLEQQRKWLLRHGDRLRHATLAEPRGHRDLVAVLLTEPVSPGADAGVLFLDAEGCPALSGTSIIAVVTIALEGNLITKPPHSGGAAGTVVQLLLDCPLGAIAIHARVERRDERLRVTTVRITGLASFVARAACDVRLGARRLPVDLAYGGGFYAIVDSETAGIPLTPNRLSDLRRLGIEITAALAGHDALIHPTAPGVPGIVEGVVFTSQPQSPDAHLRTVTVMNHGGCDRSAGVTGTWAVMAVLHAMGLLREGDDFVSEGLLGLTQRGSIERTQQVGETSVIIPETEATAWIIGEQTLFVDDEDPLKNGYRVE